jgi:hypothetical protein
LTLYGNTKLEAGNDEEAGRSVFAKAGFKIPERPIRFFEPTSNGQLADCQGVFHFHNPNISEHSVGCKENRNKVHLFIYYENEVG